MARIKKIEASEILSSNGTPTVQATVVLSDGEVGIASFPTGEDTLGAVELRDNDKGRYDGKGVLKAVANVFSPLAARLMGKDAQDQQGIDKYMMEMDGTMDKSNLGANAIFSVSMAIARAEANSAKLPLYIYLTHFLRNAPVHPKIPTPLFNIINGSKNPNSGFQDFYEFIVIPASSKTYTQSLSICDSVRKSLARLSESKGIRSFDKHEGLDIASIPTSKDAFLLMIQAIENASLRPGFDVFFGLNCKASNLFSEGKYKIKGISSPLSSQDLLKYYEEFNQSLNLLYLEDPFEKNDWNGWTNLANKFSPRTLVVGGDVVSTNLSRLQTAIEKKATGGIVIIPSQAGTVIEALAITQAARAMGLKIIVSHRSNETNDDFIADFSMAVNADYVKFGSLARGENIAKYNRLLQIENQLKIL